MNCGPSLPDLWENTTQGCALLATGSKDKSLLKPTSNFVRGPKAQKMLSIPLNLLNLTCDRERTCLLNARLFFCY
jgi:hypothetical protein